MSQNNTLKTIHTNVNEQFEQEISLWKLITHEPAVEILQRTVLCHQNDIAEGRSSKVPSIMISANTQGLGSETLARSLASSLAMPLKVGFGSAISFDYQVKDFFLDASEDTAFYIREAEKLNPSIQQNLYYVIKNQILKIPNRYGEPKEYVPFQSRLIILGTTQESVFTQSLVNIFDLRLSLTLYSHQQIVQILKQRVAFLGWQIESDAVLDFIALSSNGSPNQAVWHLLQTAYTIMRSESKDVMEMKHVTIARSLTKRQRNE